MIRLTSVGKLWLGDGVLQLHKPAGVVVDRTVLQ